MPEGGFESFPKIPKGFRGSVRFAEFLVEKAGVLVKPGVYFGPAGDQNFRVVYCREEEVLKEALERISEVMLEAKTVGAGQ